jgi:hypothetical protein
MNIRTPKRGRRKKMAAGRGFTAEWREPKIYTVYTLDQKGRCLKGGFRACDGTLNGPDKLIDIVAMELCKHEAAEAVEIVILGDGAPWIWNRIDELIQKAGLDPSRVTRVLDFYHAVEHLTAFSNAIPGYSARQRTLWFNRMKDLLKTGDTNQFLAELHKVTQEHRRQKLLQRERQYFVTQKHAIRYKEFTDRSIPIGSGAVESAVRRVINLRLKGAGMFWLKHNAEGFLHLRCQLKSGNWHAHFQSLIERSLR